MESRHSDPKDVRSNESTRVYQAPAIIYRGKLEPHAYAYTCVTADPGTCNPGPYSS